ncbi:MAG: NAD(P)-dependent oxidoreductase [Alphaproteobacteria bacterium]|nr:NAD(P)-dependent oxidoreductase [Alphaproteobacteria bacterium]
MTDNKDITIAFLGIGLMGIHMAERLLRDGFAVNIWNRSQPKLAPLIELGAVNYSDANQAVDGADVVITMLQNGDIVDDVLYNSGAINSIKSGALVIDTSSVAPLLAKKHCDALGALGIDYLDSPVSGGTKGAELGTLVIMAGGTEAAFKRAEPVYATLGRATHIGKTGSGQLAKLANQTIVAITLGAVSEGLLLAAAGGADAATVRECLMGGFADSRILTEHGLRMVERNFTPGGPNVIFVKDMKAILEAAAELKLDLPLLRHVNDVYKKMCDDGQGDLDHASYILALEAANLPHRL